ncbi:MAG: hypothetical protein KAH98_03480 [Dehalococcoidia bacterium]|nr:hypothetical protein [Dehalococcoidia bacterium]MCK5654176.1 hypothetical protein [Dehalococcoidia bacterium]
MFVLTGFSVDYPDFEMGLADVVTEGALLPRHLDMICSIRIGMTIPI